MNRYCCPKCGGVILSSRMPTTRCVLHCNGCGAWLFHPSKLGGRRTLSWRFDKFIGIAEKPYCEGVI